MNAPLVTRVIPEAHDFFANSLLTHSGARVQQAFSETVQIAPERAGSDGRGAA
jgi:hypothetical protein